MKFCNLIFFILIFIPSSLISAPSNCTLHPYSCNQSELEQWIEDVEMLMHFSKPEYQGSVSNLINPIEIEYNLPSKFIIKTKRIIPTNISKDINSWLDVDNMNYNEDGETCKSGYQKKSSGVCGNVNLKEKILINNEYKITTLTKTQKEIDNYKKLYKEINPKFYKLYGSPLPKYDMQYEMESNQTYWGWFGTICEMFLQLGQKIFESCDASYFIGSQGGEDDYSFDKMKFKKTITKNGDELRYYAFSGFNPIENKWEDYLEDNYLEQLGDFGDIVRSLTSLITPIFTSSKSWYGTRSKGTNFFKQGEKIYEYKLRYTMNFAVAAGVNVNNWIYDLDCYIIGKTNFNGRDSLLIDLKTNKKPPIVGEPQNKYFEMDGYQILDIDTGLIVKSRINVIFNFPNLDNPEDSNVGGVFISFLEKDIYF